MKANTRIKRRGLTLAELLVVLTILAITATVAVVMTGNVVGQGRIDATMRTFQSIENAIVGPASQRGPDGSLLVTGFVADVGRPPALSELVANPPAAGTEFTARRPVDENGIKIDSEVLILSGFRPPYLLLPNGKPVDGWGNEIQYQILGGTIKLKSWGADGVEGGIGADADIPYDIGPARYKATVWGNVHLVDYSGELRESEKKVRVNVFGPNGDILATSISSVLLPSAKPPVYHFALNVTIGPRVIRAYEVENDGVTVVRKSRIVSIMVPPEGLTAPQLNINGPDSTQGNEESFKTTP